MSNVCPRIRLYSGTKSQKILEMIAEKRREEINKKIPELIKDQRFVIFKKAVHMKQRELEIAQKRLNQRMNELGIQEGYGKNKYRPLSFCDCDKLTAKRLQEAQDLWALGKKKEADELWEKIMKQHKLLR